MRSPVDQQGGWSNAPSLLPPVENAPLLLGLVKSLRLDSRLLEGDLKIAGGGDNLSDCEADDS